MRRLAEEARLRAPGDAERTDHSPLIEGFRYCRRVGARLPSPEMPEYLLEFYMPRDAGRAATDDGESARAAAEELMRRGTTVAYRRVIFVPAEETCFLLFEAESAEAVRDAATLAALPCDRVTAVYPQTTECRSD